MELWTLTKLYLNTGSRGKEVFFNESHGKQHGEHKDERTNPTTVRCHA